VIIELYSIVQVLGFYLVCKTQNIKESSYITKYKAKILETRAQNQDFIFR